MKAFIISLISSFCFLIPMNSMAQAYVPMLSDSSHWWVVTDFFGYNSESYYAKEDTIMDNKPYKFIDGFHFNKNVFLREDSVLRHVYYRQKKGFKANQDVLIYDFSLQIGDSMLLFNPNTTLPDSVGYFVVDSIAMTTILTGKRKTWYLSKSDGSDRAIWIEGIGSTSLVNASSGIGDAVKLPELSCFHQDQVHVYQSALSASFGACGFTTVGFEESQTEQDLTAVLVPNPASTFVQLNLIGTFNTVDITLYHSDGRLIKDWTDFKDRNLQIDLSLLKSGLYLVQVRNENNLFHATLIKE